MTDTLTEKMTAVYEKEFKSRFETELKRPIRNIINNTLLQKELLKYTESVDFAREVTEWTYENTYTQNLRKLYIEKRLAEAVNFINQGAQNGT